MNKKTYIVSLISQGSIPCEDKDKAKDLRTAENNPEKIKTKKIKLKNKNTTKIKPKKTKTRVIKP